MTLEALAAGCVEGMFSPGKMKDDVRVLLYIFVGCLVGASPPSLMSREAGRLVMGAKSDIFIITIDTLRADHVGCYGAKSVLTPALDSLAAQGVRFANAFTPSPITNASHASILTGLIPTHHGVGNLGVALGPDVPTLPDVLKASGYSTAAFIGSVILDSTGLARGFDRGFDSYDNFPASIPKTASRYVRLERRGMEVERRAEAWVLRHAQVRPKFVWVHFYDPHDPYDPPEPYRTKYAHSLYDGEIAYTDSALRRFVDFLKRQKLYQSSLLVVVGDHGEGLGEHGEATHGIFLYDSTTHVPLILKLPKAASATPAEDEPHGVVVAAQVRTIDIFPTVLDIESIPYGRSLDGASLRPLWVTEQPQTATAHGAPSGPGLSDRVAFGETDYPLALGWAALRSVRTHTEKYIEAPRAEFYDLRTDPGEARNIYDPRTPGVQRLQAQLADLRKTAGTSNASAATLEPVEIEEPGALGAPGSGAPPTPTPQASPLPDPKDKIQLHNLIHNSMLAVEDGDLAGARHNLIVALNLDSQSAVVLAKLGELELRLGHYTTAADLLGRALNLTPEDANVVLAEARARYASGDVEAARSRLEGSENALVGNYDAAYLLGKIDCELKDWDSAEDQLRAAIILDPARPEAYIELGRVYLTQRKTAEALKHLRRARRLAPGSQEVSSLLSEAHWQDGRGSAAKSGHNLPSQ